MNLTVTRTQDLAASPELVWNALTDAASLRAWFAEDAVVDLRVGGAYRFWGRHTLGAPSAGEATQTLTAVMPNERLSFSWELHGIATSVTVSLAATDAGSKLTLVHEVSSDLLVPRSREYIDDHWGFQCGNLMAHLDGGAGIVRPDFTDPSPEVRLSITIDAPRAVVWETLLDPARVAEWLSAPNVRIGSAPGGEYRLGWEYKIDGRDVTGGPTRILTMEPERRLVLDWPDWRGDPSVTGQWISFTLEGDGDRTTVHFVHGGFGRTADIGDYPFGWAGFTGELKRVAERHAVNGGTSSGV